ncbi:MAG: host attachment protein [Myxococcota bacterium]
MVETWVVVADGGSCRIFGSDAALTSLAPVKELKNKHHVGDHRGVSARGHDSSHHAIETKFAAEIAGEIARAIQAKEARDILLVAPKRFLGDLLGALPKAAADRVTGRVPKDLTATPPHELAGRLRAALSENHDLH